MFDRSAQSPPHKKGGSIPDRLNSWDGGYTWGLREFGKTGGVTPVRLRLQSPKELSPIAVSPALINFSVTNSTGKLISIIVRPSVFNGPLSLWQAHFPRTNFTGPTPTGDSENKASTSQIVRWSYRCSVESHLEVCYRVGTNSWLSGDRHPLGPCTPTPFLPFALNLTSFYSAPRRPSDFQHATAFLRESVNLTHFDITIVNYSRISDVQAALKCRLKSFVIHYEVLIAVGGDNKELTYIDADPGFEWFGLDQVSRHPSGNPFIYRRMGRICQMSLKNGTEIMMERWKKGRERSRVGLWLVWR